MIDWEHFTPWAALTGGVLIGIASAMYIVLHGRILGISGIVGGLLCAFNKTSLWRMSFLLGMFLSPWIYAAIVPPSWLVKPTIDANWGLLIVAGLLVGLGSRLGSGCTSGHGVCGISRFSLRSIVATVTFIAVGMGIVAVLRFFVS